MNTRIPRQWVFVILMFVCILILSSIFPATVVANKEYSHVTSESRYDLLDYEDKNNKPFSETDNMSYRYNQLTDNKVKNTDKFKSSGANSRRFIVVFSNFTSRNPKIINQTGARVTGGQNIDITPVLFAVGSDSARSEIREISYVKRVMKDEPFRTSPPPTNLSNTSNGTISTGASSHDQSVPWGVSRINGQSASESVSKQAQADVNIAVLDTGIDYTHPDIDDNVAWGANFVGGVEKYGVKKADDNHGHGTMVAGLAAAENNDRGIVGVAPHAKIYSIKVLNENNYGYYSWWIRGLDAAVKGPDNQLGTDDDADIVSVSLGGDSNSESLKNAIESASEYSLIVTAAMNSGDGDPTTNEVHYPAKYPETIAVAATTRNDQTATFSSEGAEVEVAAPGVGILTLSKDGGTNSFSGTSASTPLVSGTLALMMAKNQSMSANEYRRILRKTAVDIESSGVDKKAGHGLVQADTAVQRVDPGNFDVKINSTNAPITAGETLEVMTTVENTGNELATKNVELYVSGVGSNSTRLTLSKSESKSLTLSVDTDEDDSGSPTVETSTPDDSAEKRITIGERPEFNISIQSTNAPVTPQRTLKITATVINTGNKSATKDVELSFPVGRDLPVSVYNSSTITLSGGESQNVTLSVGAGYTGNRVANISTPDDSATRRISITNRPVNIVNTTLEPSTIDTGGQSNHILSFEAQNVSADGNEDNFELTFPANTEIDSFSDVAIDEKSSGVNKTDNTLEFSVNPTGGGSVQISGELNVTLSATN
jgi:hypothetical protein